MSPSATYFWNAARVGAGSLPVTPPMPMIALSVPRMYPAADCAPVVAAAQRVVVASSSATSSLLVVVDPPPGAPPVLPVAPGAWPAVPSGDVAVPGEPDAAPSALPSGENPPAAPLA